MKTFIDNLAVYAIECALLSNVSDLFTPSSVYQMSEKMIKRISTESPYNVALREETSHSLEVLQNGLAICRAHAGRLSVGKDSILLQPQLVHLLTILRK